MNTISINGNSESLILSTGSFDLLKEQVKKKKLSRINEVQITLELKSAKQVLTNQIPPDVVSVGKSVTVKALDSGEVQIYNFVAPDKAKKKNNTVSIISPIGVALLGYKEGSELHWDTPEGLIHYRIEEVKPLTA